MNHSQQLFTPIALLVLYDSGYKFRFKKYYLREGKNRIGSDVLNQIVIGDVPALAANLVIKQDLAYIEPLADGCVHVPSNMNKKNGLMVELNKGWRFVIEMEKDFFVCKKKALMQVLSVKELLQVRGIQNQAIFLKQSNTNEQIKGNARLSSHIGQFDATLPIDNQHTFQATIPLDDHYLQATVPLNDNQFSQTIPLDDNNFDATLLLNDNNAGFEATIQMDEYMIHSGNQEQQPDLSLLRTQSRGLRSSQFAHMNSLSNESVNLGQSRSAMQQKSSQNMVPQAEEEREVSMPDTLQEIDMPDTLQQQMPATLQQDTQHASSGKKMSQSVPTKSKTKVFDPISKNFHSLDEKPKEINDFDDLFANEGQSAHKNVQFSHSVSAPENRKSIQHSESSDTEKLEQPNQSNKPTSSNRLLSQQKSLKKAGVLGCKRADVNLKSLKEKGYTLVEHPDEEFDLLLVGVNGLKLCRRIMLAFVENKEIRSLNWIKDPNAKINGKIQGFPWQMIQKNKGKTQQIFKGKYYLQEELREEFQDVIEKAGAEIENKLTKGKNRSTISIIIDEKSENGIAIYKQYHNYKKWKFYKKKMLVESIFIAQEIKEKYEIQDYEL